MGNEVSENYIIQSLRDSIKVLDHMMQDLSPNRYYTVTELAEMFPKFTANKIFRILKTFLSLGWVEAEQIKGKSFKIGHSLLYLSHRYLNKLHEEHLKIQDEVNSFRG